MITLTVLINGLVKRVECPGMGYSKLLACCLNYGRHLETEATGFPKQIQEPRMTMAGKELSVVYKQGLPSQ